MINSKIKVAMVAPPFGLEGGPEVVCRHLTDALLKKGVEITLFAPGDWKTRAKHIHTLPMSLWKMKNFKKQTEFFRKNLIFTSQLKVTIYQENFDIIHLHSQRSAYTVAKLLKKPCVLTLHNPICQTEFAQLKEAGVYTVALSSGRRKKTKATAVIENGLSVEEINYSFKKGKYLIAVGRIIKQKGIETAIKIAKKTRKKLIIIGRIGNSPERQRYFKQKIKPFLNDKIILMNQMPQHSLYKYLREAETLLSPIEGNLTLIPMVVMESLACGTPVLGTVIQPMPRCLKGKSIGFFSNNFDDLVKAAKNTDQFSRKTCRECAEKNFDSGIMAEKYIQLYRKIIQRS